VYKFAIDKNEFGETYHVGAAMVFCTDVEAYLVGDGMEDRKEFLSSLGGENRVHCITRNEYDCERDKFNYVGCTTNIIKQHFQNKRLDLEKFFLGRLSNEELKEIKGFLSQRIKDKTKKYVLVWIRNGGYKVERNITSLALKQLEKAVKELGYDPIYIGEKIENIDAHQNLIEYYKDSIFTINRIRRQLWMFKLLQENCVICATGMMSGGIDGPAFLGMPTIYFAKEDATGRMKQLDGVIPRYHHIPIEYKKEFEKFSEEEIGAFKNILKEMELNHFEK
jgi:hypothetical protein